MEEDNRLISHRTLSDQAFDYLSQSILSGELQNGERLVESELSNKLGISRAPIREALAKLERQGLACHQVRRGTFVRSWTKQDLWEVATLRAAIETLVVELAIKHINEDDVSYLEEVIEDMEKAERKNDLDSLFDLDFKFHDRVLELCQHKRVQRMSNEMRLQVWIFRSVTKGTDYQTYPEMHRELLDSLIKGDIQEAKESIRLHIIETAELALSTLPDDEPISVTG